jgi:molybdate transport system permease protein
LWTEWNGPLMLSARVALTATLLCALIGLPLSYLLSRWRGPWALLLETCLIAPLVLPPTVVGYFLLTAFGRRTPLGNLLQILGVDIVFTEAGAVIAAAVVAMPLMVMPTKAAFQSVSRNHLALAAVEGLSVVRTFVHVVLPIARRGVFAGLLLCFARALGEFGATLMVAGNIPGRTTTLPMVIYTAMATGDDHEAWAPTILLTALALLIVGLHRWTVRGVR